MRTTFFDGEKKTKYGVMAKMKEYGFSRTPTRIIQDILNIQNQKKIIEGTTLSDRI